MGRNDIPIKESSLGNKKKLEFKDVTKKYGNVLAVDSVSFYIEQGEFMFLLGPSGCGKTTTLRMIAGFEKLTKGIISIDGRDITNIPPYKRSTGFIFQNYALWPHMTVFENIALGLKIRKIETKKINQRIEEVCSLLKISGLEGRYPRELSGGQQQRAAIARVLAIKPDILLMDEPLSSLDKKLREYMRIELRQIQRKLRITALYVTHDQTEAFSMADRIVIMNNGRIIQIGKPTEIYDKPKNKFVADFVGNVNFFEGEILEISTIWATFKIHNGPILKVFAKEGLKLGDKLNVMIRPEKLMISSELNEAINIFSGKVKFVEYGGSILSYFIELDNYQGKTIVAQYQNIDNIKLNENKEVFVKIDPKYCTLI